MPLGRCIALKADDSDKVLKPGARFRTQRLTATAIQCLFYLSRCIFQYRLWENDIKQS